MNEAAQVTPAPYKPIPCRAPQQAEGINSLDHPMWEALIEKKKSSMETILKSTF